MRFVISVQEFHLDFRNLGLKWSTFDSTGRRGKPLRFGLSYLIRYSSKVDLIRNAYRILHAIRNADRILPVCSPFRF
jgi:hypothetical protein